MGMQLAGYAVAEAPVMQRFDPDVLRAANINPETLLATDYLNHYNEVLMLVEMLAGMPDSLEDVLDWKPVRYRDYFVSSNYRDKDLAIACCAFADPALLDQLNVIIDEADEIITEIIAMLRQCPADPSPEFLAVAAFRASEEIRPLLSKAGHLINGGPDDEDIVVHDDLFDQDLANTSTQDDIDALFG